MMNDFQPSVIFRNICGNRPSCESYICVKFSDYKIEMTRSAFTYVKTNDMYHGKQTHAANSYTWHMVR